MPHPAPRTWKINPSRLQARLEQLAAIGALPGGGVSRMALTREDGQARDQLKRWLLELDLDIRIDRIGNMIGLLPGKEPLPPIAMGSHLDTVGAAGIFDGALGVAAALEVIQTIREQGHALNHPLALFNFTNEEGVRFAPDMMGSHVYAGGLPVEAILPVEALDGSGLTVGQALEAIGYAGDLAPGAIIPAAFLELHIEQGPVLEADGQDIGIVEMVQGIYWTEYRFAGQANHAGTTPMAIRRDAALAAARLVNAVRELVQQAGGHQVGTVGQLELAPNLVNVVAQHARLIVDLRNTEAHRLQQVQDALSLRARQIAAGEGLTLTEKALVRFPPVRFSPILTGIVESVANAQGLSYRRMPSGAGHDAQMMAGICPSAMIFVPSVGGISHNPAEYTPWPAIEKGANALLQSVILLDEQL